MEDRFRIEKDVLRISAIESIFILVSVDHKNERDYSGNAIKPEIIKYD